MEPIVLREEDPPEGAVVLIRGGEMTASFVARSATAAHDELGIYALSVFLAIDQGVSELCADQPVLLRYGKVRLSTVGRVRSHGFPLLPTLGRPHDDIVLPDLTAPTLDRLEQCFDPPIPNPARPPGGSDASLR